MRNAPLSIRVAPDWTRAAQALIDGCAGAPDASARVELLRRLCTALGDALYPAFLGVLCRVSERGSAAAQAAVAQALVDALRTGEVPSARRGAWGSASPPMGAGRTLAGSLGPIEYLCAWHADRHDIHAPGAVGTERALIALLRLVSQEPHAKAHYSARLRVLADDPPDGALNRSTRLALRCLADAWEAPAGTPERASDACVRALNETCRMLRPSSGPPPAIAKWPNTHVAHGRAFVQPSPPLGLVECPGLLGDQTNGVESGPKGQAASSDTLNLAADTHTQTLSSGTDADGNAYTLMAVLEQQGANWAQTATLNVVVG